MLISNLLFLVSFAKALRRSGNGILPNQASEKRVAIIGAGAAGSSAAYHLAQYAEDAGVPAQITVYERNNYIGGRSTTVNAWNDASVPIELGGSIFVDVNKILVHTKDTFNLSIQTTSDTTEAPVLGIWNGNEFVLQQSSEISFWDYGKLFWRYGLAPLWASRVKNEIVDKFMKMYEAPIFPWTSLTEATEKVGLKETLGMTGQQLMKARKIGDLFAQEVVQSSTRVNYASNLGLIHGVETMVCMATNGAMAIAGGNWQMFAAMLNSSCHISTQLNTRISNVSRLTDSTYNLVIAETGEVNNFDEVILAAPFQFADLDISPLEHVPDRIPYVDLHVTLFASPHKLNPTAFNMEASKNVPDIVLTTLPPGEDHGADPNGVGQPGFFSLSTVGAGVNPHAARMEYIYKIFTPTCVNATFLSDIIGHQICDQESDEGNPNGDVSWIHRKIWHSYPYEYPRVTFEEVTLGNGLWYTSGIESFISTMETSALSGKNIAKLMVGQWATDRNIKGTDVLFQGRPDEQWGFQVTEEQQL